MAAAAIRLGITSKFYYASVDVWGSETWTVNNRIADLTVNPNWPEIVGSDRGTGVESVAKGIPTCEITGRMRVDETDAGYQAVYAKFLSRTPLNCLILNGPKDSEGAQGFKGYFHVLGGQTVQNLDNVLFVELRFKPAIVSSLYPFKSVVVNSSSVLVYTDFLPPP